MGKKSLKGYTKSQDTMARALIYFKIENSKFIMPDRHHLTQVNKVPSTVTEHVEIVHQQLGNNRKVLHCDFLRNRHNLNLIMRE